VNRPNNPPGQADRAAVVRAGRRLQYATMAWNAAECVVALTAGFVAASIALVGFGFDSAIEVTSSVAALWRLWRDRIHFHRHGHADGTQHFHAHSHAGETVADTSTVPHARAAHAHAHGFRWRTLLVGLMHGMAGSAALLVLTVTQAPSPLIGLGYVALFGVGSMIGMGVLSSVIAVPLAASARWLTWANQGLQFAVGLVTIAIGIHAIIENAFS